MLLDTGKLHCDPHPGNLVRSTDGRLFILDWGMTLDVQPDLQYSLLEFIAHVNTEQMDAIPQDLVNLGFSPADQLEKLKNSGLGDGLAFAFRQLNKGGGPSKIRARLKEEFAERYGAGLSDDEIRERARAEMVASFEQQLKREGVDVQGVSATMEAMSRRNRELFKLPAYTLYVSRAFSTLEGIGLGIDPDYSILSQCFPYLSKRLFQDSSPRATDALRSMVFGAGLDAPKIAEMIAQYRQFSSSALTVTNDQKEATEKGLEAFQQLLLDPSGSNPIQSVLAEGAARFADSLVREGYSRATLTPLGQAVSRAAGLGKSLSEALPTPLQPLAAPLLVPWQLNRAVNLLLSKSQEDERVMDTLSAIFNSTVAAEGGSQQPSSSFSIPNLPPPTPRNVRTLAQTVPRVVLNGGKQLGRAMLLRAAERMDRVAAESDASPEDEQDTGERVGLAAAKASSNFAKQLAEQL